ncbi:Na+/H+ antiporter NhaA [Actinomadura citrea]|uniref:Na(+)/H(+) antiporter NhaA n=1 Tax=Actinomadura citrea TaxID=46158 RepID=A0A7Y9GAX4_9ACTN|nr:Na+/H+ antiporter NhaA [Actinomadura citrea]NYE13142.1 Na+/H+ antiporter NhaA [Actinomadura citrea]GGU09929.1 Na(+)/H(+) antiporter NhaA 2 [Actinomadura citrea]
MTERRAGPPSGSFADRTAWARNLPTPLREFMRTETGGAVVLLAATLAALVWANADASSYDRVWETQVSVRFGGTGLSQDLRDWVNNGLMTVFFFVVGLEARREFDMGELRDRRRFALPLAAGVGGMVVPVAIYLAFNAGGPAAHGWGIAMSTDTAFALGVLALVGRTFPPRLRTYLLTATVVDDVIALAVIAIVYSGDVALPPLLLAVGILAVTVLVRALGVRQIPVYVVLGVAAWAAVQSAGVEPVVVGLVMGLLTYAHPAARDDLERATEVFRLFREQPTPEFARSARTGVAAAISPNERLQLLIHPWTSYAVVPLFALANAGVTITAGFLGRAFTSTVTLGIVIGYVVGKPLGILGASWLVTRVSRGRLRPPVGWAAVGGGGAIAGIGFTVALLIATLSFTDARLEEAKIGVLSAALCATVVTWVVVRATALLPPRRRLRALLGTAESIIDLAAPVEPDRDHVRGPEKAPVTVVEYGDFECPYCGRAESVVRELLADYGDVRYVWRHLPLNDIHPQAQLAAEAAEAAAAQGRFWEMHDLLLDRQDALRPRDLVRYAGDIGLDVDRFRADLRRHTGAGRIAEDVDSADLSGVSGTPTFFVNGRRHVGAYDIATLSAAVRGARKRAAVGS